MATTYTENYHLGKQENHADKFRMDVITANMDIIDEQIKKNEDEIASAKGTYTTLNDRLSGIESEQESQGAALDEDREALVELVDGGAKNLAAPLDVANREGLTITNDNGQYTMTGTITRPFTGYLFRPAEPLQLTTDCIIIGAEQLTGLSYSVAYRKTAESETRFETIGTNNKILPSGAVISYIYAQQNNAGTAISAKINLMLCTVADYAISHKFVPYRPSYDELIARIEALEGGA